MKAKGLQTALLSIALTLCAAQAVAQSTPAWPSRPLRLVAPYPPGGLNDFLSRLLGPKLSEALGQQVLIENRTGAGGMIGTEAVVKAPADGYTVLVASGAEIAINQHLYAKVPYNAEQDLVPITLVAITPLVLVAHAAVPANSLQELVALAKAKPATLGFASVGDGSSQHLTGEMLMAAAGIRLVHVPYKGAGQSLPDLLGGQIPLGIYGVSTIYPHVKAGKVKVLAVSTPKRSAAVPDWPTMAESGYPGFDTSLWVGLLVRTGTPKEVVDRLNAEAVRILKQPEVVERMAAQGADTVGSSAADFKAFIAGESAKYSRIIKQLGIKAS